MQKFKRKEIKKSIFEFLNNIFDNIKNRMPKAIVQQIRHLPACDQGVQFSVPHLVP